MQASQEGVALDLTSASNQQPPELVTIDDDDLQMFLNLLAKFNWFVLCRLKCQHGLFAVWSCF